MASKFQCDCGATVRTNLFEGHGGYLLISEDLVEGEHDDVETDDYIDKIVRVGTQVAECPGCGRLALIDGDYNVRLYSPIPGAEPLAEFVRKSEDV